MRRRRAEVVYGHVLPAPRVTLAGLAMGALYLGPPLVAALLLFDVIFWALGFWLFDACVAVWCLI